MTMTEHGCHRKMPHTQQNRATASLDSLHYNEQYFPNISSLPRFTISVILSYLQLPPPHHFVIERHSNVERQSATSPPPFLLPHNRDAISFLLTTKRYAYAILPLFRVPKTAARTYHTISTNKNDSNSIHNDEIISLVEKYRFIVLPIQDPRTLLDRLNTRRLRARIGWSNRMTKNISQSLVLNNENDSRDATTLNTQMMTCYAYGRTIDALAHEEWCMMEIHHADAPCENNTQRMGNSDCKRSRVWPTHLELLQFLDGFDTEENSDNRKKMEVKGAFAHDNDFCGRILPCGVTLLASYPRSGNTLLRTLLERITSIVTGSDTRPDRTLSKSLALEHDLVGEGLVGGIPISSSSRNSRLLYQSAFDPLVHIVKTHFPERIGWKPVTGNRVLLLIRNPYDAIDSYWNLCCTNTHTRTLDESVYAKYAQKFEDLSRHEIQVWCDFHYYWIDTCEKEGVPIFIVRYEDLVLDTEVEMGRIMEFVLGIDDDALDSLWKWRIRHAISSNSSTNEPLPVNFQTSNLGSYKPRSSNGGLSSIGKSVRKGRFSEDVLLHMHEVAVSIALERKQASMNIPPAPEQSSQRTDMTLLQRFGYDIYTQQFPDNFQRLDKLPSQNRIHRRGCGSVTINKTPEIRRQDDPFGRAMTFWRRGETHDDTVPFSTVPR